MEFLSLLKAFLKAFLSIFENYTLRSSLLKGKGMCQV